MEQIFEVNPKLEALLDDMRTKKVALEFGNDDQIRAMKYAQRKSAAIEAVRQKAHDDGEDEDDAEAEIVGEVYSVDLDIEASDTITVEVRDIDSKHAEELAREKFEDGAYAYDYDSWSDVSLGGVYARKKA
jgi:hypothetical protein